MNDFIKLMTYNYVYPIKYNKNILPYFISDVVPSFSDKFIYDYDNLQVKGADGYCIISHEKQNEFMEAQRAGYMIIYDGSGGLTTYKTPKLPEDKIWYKPQFDYENEIWEETATEKEIIQIIYDKYKLHDTPRYSRLMTKAGVVEDYDNFMLECKLYLESLNPTTLPVPSEPLKEFIDNNKQ